MKWSEQLRWREEVHKRYPDFKRLKIVRKRLPFILEHLKEGEAVLEIGAFNRELGDRIKRYSPRTSYKSVDIDPAYPHDYSSLEEVKEKFDMVLLFEVIEHLDWNEGRKMVAKIFEILNPGGRVILSTPNVYTPGQYWKDASHRTPYHYEELGGLLLSQRFELLKICRLYSEPVLKFFIKAYLLSSLFHLLSIDFTKSILIVGRKA
jgi:SAM-dependent methyltransferase